MTRKRIVAGLLLCLSLAVAIPAIRVVRAYGVWHWLCQCRNPWWGRQTTGKASATLG